MIDIDFLTADKVSGLYRLKIFDYYGKKAILSDYAILNGAKVYRGYNPNQGNIQQPYGCYIVKGARGMAIDGYVADSCKEQTDTFRLCFDYSQIKEFCTNERDVAEDVLEAEFGSSLQEAVSREMQHELNCADLKSKRKIENIENKMDICGQEIPLPKGTYEYKNKRYENVLAKFNKEEELLSNGIVYKYGQSIWVEEKPNIILVDKKTNIAVFKDLIIGPFPFYIKTTLSEDLVKQYWSFYFLGEIQKQKRQKQEKRAEQLTNQINSAENLSLPPTKGAFVKQRK